MFIAALFTISRRWKQPRCPSTDDWIKKLWYIYVIEYYSAIKKNTYVMAESSEKTKIEKDRYTPVFIVALFTVART